MSKGLNLALCYMSFLPLWILILFIDIKSVVFDKNERYITEYISIIVIVLNLIICLIYAFFMLKSINRSEDAMHYTIKSVKENKESIPNYLVTYILPLLAFDFTTWYGVMLFLLFYTVLCYLYLNHCIFSVNLFLDFLNYRVYECELCSDGDVIVHTYVISKKRLIYEKEEFILLKSLNNDIKIEIDV